MANKFGGMINGGEIRNPVTKISDYYHTTIVRNIDYAQMVNSSSYNK